VVGSVVFGCRVVKCYKEVMIDGDSRRLLLSAVGIVVALGLVAGAWWLPLGREAVEVILLKRAPATHELSPGDTVAQRIVTSRAERFGGFTVYADAKDLGQRQLAATIRDDQGTELAHGFSAVSSYAPDETLRVELPTEWMEVEASKHLLLEITLVSGPSLALRVSPLEDNIYPSGEFRAGNERLPQDLALDLIRVTPLPLGTRLGVVAAAVFLLGVLGLQFVPRRRVWLAAALLLAVVTPLSLLGYWNSTDLLGIADWDYYFSLHHYYRTIILDQGVFPFWNPYTCGGTAGLGDPEFPVFTPTFLLELLFGIPTGVRLAIVLSVAVSNWPLRFAFAASQAEFEKLVDDMRAGKRVEWLSIRIRNSMQRTMPSPPRCAPAPPEPRRMPNSRTRTG